MVLNRPADANPPEESPNLEIMKILNGLSEISDIADPDKPIGREAQSALAQLCEMIDDAEREFRDGTVVINPEGLGKIRRAAMFFKKLSESGKGSVTKIDMEPHLRPSCISFSTTGLILTGEELSEFADLVELTECVEIVPNLDGRVDIIFNVQHLWRKMEGGSESS